MQAFCLFCQTQRCGDIAAFIRKTKGWKCISPRIIQRKWVRGAAIEVSHDWLPGYLFLYTDETDYPHLQIDGIIRVLGQGPLTGTDLAFAQMIEQREGVLSTIRLAEVGDRCHIADPLWEKLEGTILKIDRGRKRCQVAFEFDNQRRSIWVGYDLVKTITEEPMQVERN